MTMTPATEWILITGIILFFIALLTVVIINFSAGIETIKEMVGIFVCALLIVSIPGSMMSYAIYESQYNKLDTQVYNMGGVIVIEIEDAKALRLERAIIKHNGKEIVNLDCLP